MDEEYNEDDLEIMKINGERNLLSAKVRIVNMIYTFGQLKRIATKKAMFVGF